MKHDTDKNEKARFMTTRWTVVLDPTARDQFCGKYWYPIYAYIRKIGRDEQEAKDFTQEFFLRFIMEKDILSKADRDKGRLRNFLKTSVKNFLHSEWKRAKSAKRGGDTLITSFDAMAAEERYLREPKDDLSPDRCYDRAWAVSVLEEIMRVIDQKYARLGGDHQACYLALRPLLDDTKAHSDDVEKVASSLGVSPKYVAERKFALRAEWKRTALAVVKRTLHDATDEEALAELRRLLEFLQADRQVGRSK